MMTTRTTNDPVETAGSAAFTQGEVWVRRVASPVGELTIAAGARGLQALLWPDEDPRRVLVPGARDTPAPADVAAVLDATEEQLGEYFAGARTAFDLPLDPHGTEFQLRAWEALRAIPYGRTVSYGEQAKRLGDVRKARAVGAANGRNPISIIVPCHRVIGADGSLTGFGGGLEAKSWLLDHERGQARLA
jgi:methylated-DNA-[protein]-cysteine S-methyltransferase